MNLEIIRRITLARQFYEAGMTSLRSANDLQLFAAANLLQDAVEIFLLAVAEQVQADIKPNTSFDQYFTAIDSKIAPRQLPFKPALLRLNKIRVSSKHHGIQPARDECRRLAVSVREFFDEVSVSILGANFATVSAVDLLSDGATKRALLRAREFLDTGDLVQCAIECRKAIYLEVENSYDVSAYKDGDPEDFLTLMRSRAPYFARNKEYIQSHVRDPTDFIVMDHDKVNANLLTNNVDTTEFWNVWRLTPPVYCRGKDDWVVRYEVAKLDRVVLEARIDYIFAAAVDIALSFQRTRQATQWASHEEYTITLKSGGVPIYEKADRTSKVLGHVPADIVKLNTSFWVKGLQDDDVYWKVTIPSDEMFLGGYISNDCLADD